MRVPYPPVDGSEPCREAPEAYFPDPGDNATAEFARSLCSRCHIEAECAAWALDQSWALDGMFGGLTRVQREQLRRQVRAA